MTKAVVFDLDDTLYAERDYVRSGFRAVALWADNNLGIPFRDGFEQLGTLFESGVRGDTFNRWLAGWSPSAKDDIVAQLVNVYRSHEPQIAPFAEVKPLLTLLGREFRLGLLSDGYLDVQKRKLRALGLRGEFDAVVFSDEWGRDAWKPSTKPFEASCDRLDVSAEKVLYVGDNPLKDFAGARLLGIRSIWIRRPDGEYTACEPPSAAFAPDLTIVSLQELPEALSVIFSSKEGL